MHESAVAAVRARHAQFCSKWGFAHPIHSSEIRACAKNFAWVGELEPARKAEFLNELGALATSAELTAVACVVDRPGYNHRYRALYGRERWSLCRTAFLIVVERAVKFARASSCRLCVYVEKSDKKTDKIVNGYYDELCANGLPFNRENSSRYTPLSASEMRETLLEFKPKAKSSPLMQLADLCLWPMCIGGYDPANRAFVALREAGTLIDCKVAASDVASCGIKYSCWDLRTAAT